MTNSDFRTTWENLPLPVGKDVYSAAKIDGSNCWLFKTEEKGLGLLMVGVNEPVNLPKLRHFEFLYLFEKVLALPGSEHRLKKCLEIHLDNSCDAELLTLVFNRMHELEPKGHFSSELMIAILQQMIQLVKLEKRPPSKEEVIGAWGELHVLERLLKGAENASDALRRIAGWEAAGPSRDIIDFRVLDVATGLAIEVKTGTANRHHHIGGVNQITVPEDYAEGYIASVIAREVSPAAGRNCKQVVDDLLSNMKGTSDQIKNQRFTLLQKINERGHECLDERYFFIAEHDALRLIKMEDMERPVHTENLTALEWTASVEDLPFISKHAELADSSFFE